MDSKCLLERTAAAPCKMYPEELKTNYVLTALTQEYNARRMSRNFDEVCQENIVVQTGKIATVEFKFCRKFIALKILSAALTLKWMIKNSLKPFLLQ